MKRIHFDKIGGNWIGIGLVILALTGILIGTFEMFDFANPKIHKYLSFIGFTILAVYNSRMFWYKNYVQWNKKGAVIRINSFLGKSLAFDQIKKSELKEKKLTITKMNGKNVTLNLNEIAENDIHKLNEIIVKHTILPIPPL